MNATKRRYAFMFVIVIPIIILLALLTNMGNNNKIVHVSGIIEEKNLDQLVSESLIIIKGTVIEETESFQIKSVNGGISNYTDYIISVDAVMRGKTDEDKITVRVQGGTIKDYTELYDQSPNFSIDESYLLFLYQPKRGGAFNTNGNYYHVNGLVQGIYEQKDDSALISQNGNLLYQEEFDKILLKYKDVQIDPFFYRNQYLENQKINLKNGFITDDEYKQAVENIDVYATVVEKDDVIIDERNVNIS